MCKSLQVVIVYIFQQLLHTYWRRHTLSLPQSPSRLFRRLTIMCVQLANVLPQRAPAKRPLPFSRINQNSCLKHSGSNFKFTLHLLTRYKSHLRRPCLRSKGKSDIHNMYIAILECRLCSSVKWTISITLTGFHPGFYRWSCSLEISTNGKDLGITKATLSFT